MVMSKLEEVMRFTKSLLYLKQGTVKDIHSNHVCKMKSDITSNELLMLPLLLIPLMITVLLIMITISESEY